MLERLCRIDDVAPGKSRRFDLGDLRIAVVRIDDDWYAVGDRCTHADVSLAEGEVDPDTLEVECPQHGSAFSLLTGEPSALPATRPTPVYELRIDGDEVFVVVEEGSA